MSDTPSGPRCALREWVTSSDPIVRVSRDSTADATDAVFEAARAAGVSVDAHPLRLNDAIDGDAVNQIFAREPPDAGSETTVLAFELWDRRFVVTPEAVEVYSA
ncbi:MAG: hypothetical protein ABEJ28_05645 [Salinigranum sp.]